jgi:hypothetical protein
MLRRNGIMKKITYQKDVFNSCVNMMTQKQAGIVLDEIIKSYGFKPQFETEWTSKRRLRDLFINPERHS